MRLNLYWRGRDVIDVELHVWRPRPPEKTPPTPRLFARADGDFERGDPPDSEFTVGFGRPS